MDHSDTVTLTGQEKRILTLMAEGRLCKEIAAEMNLTEQTIKWYRMRLRAKFNASTSSELIHKANALGLL